MKFQDLNEPKNHERFDKITQHWSRYLLGTVLSNAASAGGTYRLVST
jgi:hypothetical protein